MTRDPSVPTMYNRLDGMSRDAFPRMALASSLSLSQLSSQGDGEEGEFVFNNFSRIVIFFFHYHFCYSFICALLIFILNY